MSAHTPGPWHLVEKNTEIRIYPDWDGQPGGVALSIGSVSLTFRPRRQGSRRGEKMVYRPFSEQDRADARLLAASPDLLAALYLAFDALRQLSDEAGDVAFFNEGGDGYAACQAARLALDKAVQS